MTITQDERQLSPREELAFPFLQTAIQLDRASQSDDSRADLIAVLANNAMLWTHLKTQFSQNGDGLGADYVKYLSDVAQFMIRSTFIMARETDHAFLEKVIQINLNMCEQLLSLTATEAAGHA